MADTTYWAPMPSVSDMIADAEVDTLIQMCVRFGEMDVAFCAYCDCAQGGSGTKGTKPWPQTHDKYCPMLKFLHQRHSPVIVSYSKEDLRAQGERVPRGTLSQAEILAKLDAGDYN